MKMLSYDDVLLVPGYSDIESRGEVDISNVLDEDIILNLPVIASPMDTVSEKEMVVAMHKAGGLAIIHRYNSVREQASIAYSAVKELGYDAVLAAAVGVNGDCSERVDALIDSGITVICLDVAHGHHSLMEKALKSLCDKYGDLVHVMAGNVATLEGFDSLASWGADSIRVGIGGGSICSTRIQTGHGVPTLASIVDCAKTKYDVSIIADGGIKNSGDIIKAFAAGADFVMIGSLLAGTTEAPGKIVDVPGVGKCKKYRGMASRDAQLDWRGVSSAPEGISTMIPYKGDVENILNDMRGNIASGFSYSGARNIHEFWTKSKFIEQTSAGYAESSTHILNR